MVVPLVRLSPGAGLTLITQISADHWRAQYPGLTWHVTAGWIGSRGLVRVNTSPTSATSVFFRREDDY